MLEPKISKICQPRIDISMEQWFFFFIFIELDVKVFAVQTYESEGYLRMIRSAKDNNIKVKIQKSKIFSKIFNLISFWITRWKHSEWNKFGKVSEPRSISSVKQLNRTKMTTKKSSYVLMGEHIFFCTLIKSVHFWTKN